MRRIMPMLSLSVVLTLAATQANAALINVAPDIYRDTATNLEWLSLYEMTSEALGVTDPLDINSKATPAEILAAAAASDYVVNQGFRLATSVEVNALYAGSGGVICYAGGGLNAPLPEIFALGSPQYWNEDFPHSANYGAFEQAGLHAGAASGSTVYSRATVDIQTNANDYQNYVVTGSSYALDQAPDAEYWSYEEQYVYFPNEMSVYMVRSTVVPLPPAVWLFGSGLMALWRFRSRC